MSEFSSPSPTTDSPSELSKSSSFDDSYNNPFVQFSLKRYLAEKKHLVEKELEKSLSASSHNVQKIIESMKYSLLAGGKRIRPILCLAACEMFDGDCEVAIPTAVALEMVHTMSLIHDDLPAMDNDNLRRGKPTNHVVYGEAIAILAGDALLSTAFEFIATYTKNVSAERILEVIRRLGVAVGPHGLAGGQVKDLECENKANVTLEDLEWIHAHKTAPMLRVSVASGAVLAGATLEDVRICESFADKVGLAFQSKNLSSLLPLSPV